MNELVLSKRAGRPRSQEQTRALRCQDDQRMSLFLIAYPSIDGILRFYIQRAVPVRLEIRYMYVSQRPRPGIMQTNISNSEKLTLEDLSIGDKFRSAPYTVDAAEIKAFASQYDPQPFHLDEAEAKDTFFAELVASGWHVAAISMRLLVSSVPIQGGLIGAGGEIKWLRPTRPGDTLRVETEILEIKASRSRPDRGTVTMRSTTKNQDNERVQVMVSSVVVPTQSGWQNK